MRPLLICAVFALLVSCGGRTTTDDDVPKDAGVGSVELDCTEDNDPLTANECEQPIPCVIYACQKSICVPYQLFDGTSCGLPGSSVPGVCEYGNCVSKD